MRTVGRRKERPVSIAASGVLLAEGARFNDEIHRLPTGNSTFIPKGLYRFMTHAEANQQQLDSLAKGMAKIALLIGGYALFVHGYHRSTTDIDVLVPATEESGKKVKAALMVLPDQVAIDLEPEWFTEGEIIRVADAFLVDVMLNACGETYDTLKQFEVTVDLEGVPVRTVSLEGLLRTKQTVRNKDVADRHILERAIDTFRNDSSETN